MEKQRLHIFLFSLMTLCSTASFSQSIGKIPTQDDIIKNGSIRYFKRLPIEGWDRLLHLAKMGTYDLMLHQHKTKPLNSPFRIFHSTANRRLPSIDWSLYMKNNDHEYEDILVTNYGLCAGLTMTNRKLQMLALFDPHNLEKQKVPAESNKVAWFQFMKKKIDDMMTYNKMSIIPRFANIQEFTAHPELERYFKEHIIRQWELVNINFLQGLFQGFGGTIRKMSHQATLKNVEHLKQQLSLGINPIIFMAAPNQKLFSKDQWVHVVQVVKIIHNSNAITLEVWDPNLEDPQYSGQLIVLDNGEISFAGKILAGIYPLRWDTYEIADMIEKNLEFCISRPGFCTTKPKIEISSQPQPSQNSNSGFQSRRQHN